VKARPFSIYLTSMILFIVGPVYLTYWTIKSAGDWQIAIQTCDPGWAALLAFGVVVGFGVWHVRPWGYWALMTYSLSVIAYQAYEYVVTNNSSFYLMALMTTVAIVIASEFFQRHVSAPYFNPKMRWWERHPRFRTNIEAKFQVNQKKQNGALLDISRGGCFAQLDSILFPGDIIELRLSLPDHDIFTHAKVIWRCSEPRGYGLMFFNPNPRQKKDIDRFLDFIEKSANLHLPPVAKRVAA
jgi:hypothetical protein